MCSSNWRTSFGTLQPPRRVQVLPASVETMNCALSSCSPHWEIGSTHSPEESASGLHIITPSPMRRGCDHVGCAASGSLGLDAPHAEFGIAPAFFHLRPEEKQPAIRRHPQFGIETAHRPARIGINGQHFLPRRAVIAAGAEHDVVVEVLRRRHARIPSGPEPALRRDGHARDAGEGAVRHRMLRQRRTEMLRWLQAMEHRRRAARPAARAAGR